MTDSADAASIPGHDAEEIIASALQILKDFDSTPVSNMTPLFYQHGFEELNMAVRDLLRLLGHDPDA
ncbi:hypothetical protein [Arthrobacter globiformis]|uniref:hypothetical protein n=1 Tax=Arthrobacter globiformis TaxID=1665 RepID=UPI0027940ECF|nr:hypothetical protein [Arthrobacter globiformis]MDQ0616784.1 hypothetical protein [Arthrobacter globiformis]